MTQEEVSHMLHMSCTSLRKSPEFVSRKRPSIQCSRLQGLSKKPLAPPSPPSDHSQSPPPIDSPPKRSHGPSSSRGPSHSRGPSIEKPPSLARRVLEVVFCMCKKQTSDVYEMRKDINDIKTKLELHTRDIGEPPTFEDPFATHDAAMAAWYATQEGGANVEEEEEEEIAPAQPLVAPDA